MKTITKADWVAALRSGEYVQGTGQLRRVDYTIHEDVLIISHCCLGVACAIAELPLHKRDDWKVYEDYLDPKFGYHKIGYIPKPVGEMLGLSQEDTEILASLNDDHEYTFEQIADIIEADQIKKHGSMTFEQMIDAPPVP